MDKVFKIDLILNLKIQQKYITREAFNPYFWYLRYTIVGGNGAGNFTIDKINGKIEPIGMIDFESVPDNIENSLQFSPR